MDRFEVWERLLSNNRMAVSVLNRQEIGGARGFFISDFPSWKMCDPQCNVTQILPRYKEMGVQTLHNKVKVSVNPSGTALLTITPIRSGLERPHKLHWQDTTIKQKRTTVL